MSSELEEEAVRERVRAAFVDAEPLTPREVAVAAAVPEPAAAEALSDLIDAGELRHAQVRGVDIRQRKAAEANDDVDLEAPIDCYHRPAADLLEDNGTRDGADLPDDADRIDRRLARMDVDGASEMMRDWRRDAVRAAYEHLQSDGATEPSTLLEIVYPAHEAGVDDPEAWWEFVRPRLARLPNVAVQDGTWDVRED